MRAKLSWALLAISLALNLSFIGGVVYSKLTAEGEDTISDARIATVSEELDLSPEERAGLVALRGKIRERWGVLQPANHSTRSVLEEMLLEATLDRDRVLALAREHYEQSSQAVADSMVDLHAYLATLSEAQRRDFVEMAKQPRFFRELFGSDRTRSRRRK